MIQIRDTTIEKVSASSTWKHDTQIDFEKGTFENLSITPKSEVKLAMKTRYIEDDFYNESMIFHKDNLTIDSVLGEAKLRRKINPSKEIWNKTFGGNDDDRAYSVQQTSDGGYIVIGFTGSFGLGGVRDAWLIKTDSFGNKQWDRMYGGVADEWGFSVLQTSDGGYIFISSTGSYGAGRDDLWIVKTNSTGVEQWNRTIGGTEDDFGFVIQPTTDNGFIITGYTKSFGTGTIDLWLVKTNNTGIEQWNRSFGGTGYEGGGSVVQTSDGGFIIAGVTNSFGAGKNDAWLIKTNSNGIEQWNRTFGGPEDDSGSSAQQTADGGFVIEGETRSYGAGLNDLWLIRTNSNGKEQWNRTFGTSTWDYGMSGQKTADGGYVLLGLTYSYTVGGGDAWLIKTDSSGNEEWNVSFGGFNSEYPYSVQQTADTGFIIAGQTYSFGVGSGDMWLIKTGRLGDYYLNGILNSNNLIQDRNSCSINTINYFSEIPSNTELRIQFSKYKANWYNSLGVVDGWDPLINGANSIDLSALDWKGSEFYYKIFFGSDGTKTPVLSYINLSYKQYYETGIYESQHFNCQRKVNWKNITWDSIIPDGTEIRFQFRSSKNQVDLESSPYLGPDGNTLTYYTTPGESIWSGHNDNYTFQFIAYLNTTNTSCTPILEKVTLVFNERPYKPLLNEPLNNTWTNYNKPTFSWIFSDDDSPSQNGFLWQMDNDPDFSSIEYDSDEIISELSSFTPNFYISDGIWYWRVRTKDSEDDWGPFSSPWKIIIDTTIEKPEGLTPEPDDWTSINSFLIDWTNPEDLTGIKDGAYYYIGKSPPTGHEDGQWISEKPFTLSDLPEGENNIYVWLEDNVGNTNYLNHSSTVLKFDETPPQNLLIKINDNNQYTNSEEVMLALSAQDLLSGISEMALGSESGVGSVWQPYNSSQRYELSVGDGNKTIYFQVKDYAGNIAQTSDSIILDTAPPHSISLFINNGSTETNSTKVNLKISAIDDLSGVNQIALSDDGIDWSSWESYSENREYNLTSGDGEKRIYLKINDHAENVANPIYSAIELNTSQPVPKPKPENGKDPEPNGSESSDEKKEDNSIWMVIGIIVIVIIIISILLFFLIKRRKREEEILETHSISSQQFSRKQSTQPEQIIQTIEPTQQTQEIQAPSQTIFLETPSTMEQLNPSIQDIPAKPTSVLSTEPQKAMESKLESSTPRLPPHNSDIQTDQQRQCPTCGQDLTFYSKNNNYFCHHCKKFE
jgi:hypothetical protein